MLGLGRDECRLKSSLTSVEGLQGEPRGALEKVLLEAVPARPGSECSCTGKDLELLSGLKRVSQELKGSKGAEGDRTEATVQWGSQRADEGSK